MPLKLRFHTHVGFCKTCGDMVYYRGKDEQGKGYYECASCERIQMTDIYWLSGRPTGM